MKHPVDESGAHAASPGRKPATIALLMVAAIAAFYLLREHWGHVAGGWPYLLLLACPVMHLWHGHGGHRHPRGPGPDQLDRGG